VIKLIVAVDKDNAIGHEDGRLPWKISADLIRFKELTLESTVLMGRKTFDSLGRPNGLPKRHNVVISKTVPSTPLADLVERVEPVYFNCIATYCQAHQAALGFEPPDLWIIGGASIYKYAIEHADVKQIHLTQVHIHSGAEVNLGFNLYDVDAFIASQVDIGVQWSLVDSEDHLDHEIPFTFITLEKQ
jgi:dihydrofolate reductase